MAGSTIANLPDQATSLDPTDFFVIDDGSGGKKILVSDMQSTFTPVLSVNGDTGAVVIDSTDVGAVPESLINAKGDLIVGEANDQPQRLPVGADGEVLVVDSTETLGVKWDVPPSAPVFSVNGYTGIVVLDPDDLDDTATTNKFITASELSKLSGIESGAQVNTVTSVNSLTGAVVIDLASLGAASSDPSRAVNVVAASGATETLPAGSEFHDVTMDEACLFTFGAPTLGGHSFVLVLRGAFAPTFPSSVEWAGGSAPSYTTPSVYVFTTVNGGTDWFGAQVGEAFA